MALIVLDASVLIALLDPNDALHTAARAALARHAGDDLKLPASAYAESLLGPARRGRLAEATQAIVALLLDIVPITGEVAEEAAELRARHPSLRLPDALVVATGSVLGAAVVLTGDARWRQLGQAITIL
ncbi:MAG TPA: PIN domain-containing protein [Chloroflexota bacterium]|nr:PIN domain-containing protein [Chloroflexota bacterium]